MNGALSFNKSHNIPECLILTKVFPHRLYVLKNQRKILVKSQVHNNSKKQLPKSEFKRVTSESYFKKATLKKATSKQGLQKKRIQKRDFKKALALL